MSNSSSIPSPVYLFRIIHVDNLGFILDEQELRSPNHPNKDPAYTGIGDTSLISKRGAKTIQKGPGGTFRDYVAFYFGPRSPMLYEIKNGYNNVTKRNQEDIIYLVTTVEEIEDNGCGYVFFDGHAYHSFSCCFEDLSNLDSVDWDIVYSKYWSDREDDLDRKRRKQAEFLVHESLSWDAVEGIIVYNDNAKQRVEQLLQARSITCAIKIKRNYYY
ncbi:type II toxin-antitoxin system toxin DNA ADP-ribosyl transferase DarT [Fodinibius sp. SL11]|uniref:type II toxin-antitoxin system toxin DNA ADP-ribosyl transferase DarT n=1 Tax=Fodinibius sp. SL11 TaxID=3425690 RepID=UPI003F885A2A